jgi:hypothetical protein
MPERGGKLGNSPRNSQSRGCEGNLSHVAEEMLPERLSIICILVEEASRDEVSNMDDHKVLKEFKDIFQEVPGLPLKRDIDFSINLMPRATPVSKAPYRMSTPEIKEL